MNCMAGITCSAGMPFKTLMFLNCCSASLGEDGAWAGADCARAPMSTSPELKAAVIARAIQCFLWKIDRIERSKLIRLLTGGSLENARGSLSKMARYWQVFILSETFVTL